MEFTQSVFDLIRQRTSWRTYTPEPLVADLKQKLLHLLAENHSSPFQGTCRFVLVDMPEIPRDKQQKFGTYGVIKGAQDFIVGAVTPGPYDLEHYGYVLEKIILFATEWGLGTCWLGGSFSKSNFSAGAQLQSGEFIPAITPIGYPADNRRFTERIMRWTAGAKARKPWDMLFYLNNFGHPLKADYKTPYHDALEMVRLGPSGNNGQQWRLVVEEQAQKVHFFITRPKLKIFSFHRIEVGIAVCHFDFSVQQLGIKGEWEIKVPSFNIPNHLKYFISWKVK